MEGRLAEVGADQRRPRRAAAPSPRPAACCARRAPGVGCSAPRRSGGSCRGARTRGCGRHGGRQPGLGRRRPELGTEAVAASGGSRSSSTAYGGRRGHPDRAPGLGLGLDVGCDHQRARRRAGRRCRSARAGAPCRQVVVVVHHGADRGELVGEHGRLEQLFVGRPVRVLLAPARGAPAPARRRSPGRGWPGPGRSAHRSSAACPGSPRPPVRSPRGRHCPPARRR